MSYTFLLPLHSWFRWAVVIAGLLAFFGALSGWMKQREGGERAGLIYTILLDIQFLIGVLLLIVTPWANALTTSMGEVMKTPVIRYWTVEHGFGMIIAIVLAHVAKIAGRRAKDLISRQKRRALLYGISIAIILVTMPWPFMKYARPLFRL